MCEEKEDCYRSCKVNSAGSTCTRFLGTLFEKLRAGRPAVRETARSSQRRIT